TRISRHGTYGTHSRKTTRRLLDRTTHAIQAVQALSSPAGELLYAVLICLPLKGLEVAFGHVRLFGAQGPMPESSNPSSQARHRNVLLALESFDDPTHAARRDVPAWFFDLGQSRLQLVQIGTLIWIRLLPLAVADHRGHTSRGQRGNSNSGHDLRSWLRHNRSSGLAEG
ncbi:MAG TPA: hypothetical protein VFH51_14210, partial [Myxococcota bacterium]|nr:hypothetical protein [Myxococcota bacterium]